MDQPADHEITVLEAADRLGLSLQSVYRLIRAGELRTVESETGADGRSRPRRRSFTVARRQVDEYIDAARIPPGSLRHLL